MKNGKFRKSKKMSNTDPAKIMGWIHVCSRNVVSGDKNKFFFIFSDFKYFIKLVILCLNTVLLFFQKSKDALSSNTLLKSSKFCKLVYFYKCLVCQHHDPQF
jgi:hypothetical protein